MAKRKKKLPKRLLGKIRYNVKVDRFYNSETGQFVNNIYGMLSRSARKQRVQAELMGSREAWQEDLRRRLARKRITERKRKPPPKNPFQHEDFEFESDSGNISDYLDELILRNVEYMEEEVEY